MRTTHKLLALTIAAFTANVQQVWAGAGSPALEEVIVSARKQSELIQDVPVAVSAITADQMETAGIRDVGDLTTLVPSLVVTSNSNPFTSSYKIRRIGNEGNIPDFEPDTGLFIDGAFRSRSGLGLGDLVDIEHIEVLRGPQSTLYGKNVTAGVISVATAQPSQTFGAMGEATAGSDDLVSLRGYVNGGLTDTISGRLSLSGTQRSTIEKNLIGPDAQDMDQYAVRGQLLFDLTDDLSVRLIGAHSERDMKPQLADMFYGRSLTALTNATATNPAALRAIGRGFVDGVINPNAAPILDNDPSNRKAQAFDALTFQQEADDFIATIEWRADRFTLNSITSYDTYDTVQDWKDAGQTGLDIIDYRDRQRGDTFSQEFRIDSTFGDAITWQAGAFYYSNDFRRGDKGRNEFTLGQAADEAGAAASTVLFTPASPAFGLPILGLPGDIGNYYEDADSESIGLFGQSTWSATDDLAFTLGLRYTHESKDVSLTNSSSTGLQGRLPAAVLGQLPILVNQLTSAGRSFSADDSWSAVTGSFNTEYHISPDVMVYGTIATGFKGGGFNGGFGNTPLEKRPFDEEHVINFEVGAKTDFGGRVRANVAAFHTEYEDYQSASFVGLQFLVNNAEQVNVDGIEADVTAKLTDDLTADVSATYAHAEYDEYTQGSCYTGRVSTDAVTGACDLSGEQLPFAPDLTATAGLTWEHQFGPGSMYSRFDAIWTGDQNVTTELDPSHGEQGGYALMNFRLGWRQDIWDVSAWVKNLSDKTYYIQKAQPGVFASLRDGTYQSYLGEPQSFGVTLRAKY